MKHATPRTSQQPKTNAHACDARCKEVVRGLNQRPSRKRRARCAPGEAWQGHDHRSGCDPGGGHDRERRTRGDPGFREGDGDGGEWRQRGAVDQTEHDKREADCPQTGRTTWVAAHDSDPHRIVEAAGKEETDQGCAAVAGYQRQRRGPLTVREQPCPPECLERLGKEKQQPGCHEQARFAT